MLRGPECRRGAPEAPPPYPTGAPLGRETPCAAPERNRPRRPRRPPFCRLPPSSRTALAQGRARTRKAHPWRREPAERPWRHHQRSRSWLPAEPLKSERKADDVDARDASNPQAVTEYVNDMRAAASALYRLFFAAAARAVLPRRPSAFVDGVASTAWAVAPQTADAPGVEMGLDARVPLGVAATRTVPHSRRHAHRYVHFREKELETSVSPTYMRQQAHINEKMRAILIDWLVEVHLKFKLVPETLYLTVNLIDRYLLGSPVERSNLQLVGVSALLLASKYEEIYPPELKDLVYITDKAYTQEQILGMEEKMVKALKYKMTIASVRAPRPPEVLFWVAAART